MPGFIKGFVGAFGLIAVLLGATSPAGALPDIPVNEFGMWPPNYCAEGGGSWSLLPDTDGGTHVQLAVGTFSNTAPSGVCNTPSPAGTNVFAAWGKVEREWPYLSNSWTVCKYAPWAGNASGYAEVFSSSPNLLLGCGEGRYRLRSENRITYGGTNQTSPPFLGAPYTFGTP